MLLPLTRELSSADGPARWRVTEWSGGVLKRAGRVGGFGRDVTRALRHNPGSGSRSMARRRLPWALAEAPVPGTRCPVTGQVRCGVLDCSFECVEWAQGRWWYRWVGWPGALGLKEFGRSITSTV